MCQYPLSTIPPFLSSSGREGRGGGAEPRAHSATARRSIQEVQFSGDTCKLTHPHGIHTPTLDTHPHIGYTHTHMGYTHPHWIHTPTLDTHTPTWDTHTLMGYTYPLGIHTHT